MWIRALFIILILLTKSYALPSNITLQGCFHTVLVRGDMTVTLHQTSGPTYAVARGDSEDLAYLDFKIENDWLKVNLGKGYPKFSAVCVDIWVNNLHRLLQRGEAKVSGHHLYSDDLGISMLGTVPMTLDGQIKLSGLRIGGTSHLEMDGVNTKFLTLKMYNSSYVKLSGTIGLSEVHLYDNSWLSLYWVNTNRLDLKYGGNAFVQMAGHVNVLDLELFDNAKFAGRFLRASRSFVKTHGFSLAQISSERSQHTLALDRSNIDYFNVPLMKTDFMIQNAAVLDLREWTMPYAQEDGEFGD